MTPYKLSQEFTWRPDAEIDALRKLPFWVEFHRESGKRGLCVDRPTKVGGKCHCVAYTTKKNDHGGWTTFHLADGTGKTPLEAMGDAYRKSGRADPELDVLWEKVCGRWVAPIEVVDEFDALFD